MNSRESSRLITKFLCISLLFVFFQCTFSEPIPTDLFKDDVKENDDGNAVDLIWIRPPSYLDSDESNSDELLPKYHVYNEQNERNRPSLSSPVRRANFWKRANFWRKRANFWRRDLTA